MGRKKKYNTHEEAVEAQRRWNMEYYHRNKEMINKKNMERYYEKKEYKVDNPKPGDKKIDMVGKRIGMLTVESYYGLNKHKARLWICKCDCGNETYATTTYLRNGKKTSCGCNQYRKGSEIWNYSGYENITGSKWNSIKNNAKARGLDFTITKEEVWNMFVKQNKLCYLTNLPISFKDGTASIDRIDNDLGYYSDNIIITHKDVNIMRNRFSIEYFKELCNHVSQKGLI